MPRQERTAEGVGRLHFRAQEPLDVARERLARDRVGAAGVTDANGQERAREGVHVRLCDGFGVFRKLCQAAWRARRPPAHSLQWTLRPQTLHT